MVLQQNANGAYLDLAPQKGIKNMKTIKQSGLLLSIVAITVSTTLVLALALTDDVSSQ
ncbi:hypothetical protein JCM19233_6901 [Vibrio astriarenae]|nr:hypothetical protein JCM19233_6901 [Vibrio sp. C7]